MGGGGRVRPHSHGGIHQGDTGGGIAIDVSWLAGGSYRWDRGGYR